jgi:CRISPR-associated Csx11 family protein
MTGFQALDTLRQHRPLLLACEAIGWLHMVGKAKQDFLREHGGAQQIRYDYRKWHEIENPSFPFDDLLVWVNNKYPLKPACWSNTFTDFISKHADRDGSGILALLQAGHGMASGIEKQSYPQKTIEYLGQDITHMWLSSVFGKPVRNLLSDQPEMLSPAGWSQLLSNIEKLLKDLEALGKPTPSHTVDDIGGWWKWREEAVGVAGWLRKAFTSTLAETRLPNNDVTLFDQSYVAAALFKSALAGAILEGNNFPWNDSNLKKNTQWRLLTIGIGTDHYESRAVKIGDWTGAKLDIELFFKEVRKFVEVDLAVGSLLYKDESVCVFSFPGELVNNNSNFKDYWEEYFQKQIDSFAQGKRFEIPPYCCISEKPSRSLVGMKNELQTAYKKIAVPVFRQWSIQNGVFTNGHVCPVCLVRLNGSNEDKQKTCEVCKGRRNHRRADWLEGKLDSDSIWITEVADPNDRLALITISLDIDPWLDGSALDSLRAQSIEEWASKNSTDNNPLPDKYDLLFEFIKTAFGKGNQASKAISLIQKKLAPGLKDENQNDIPWERFFPLLVKDRSDAPKWNDLNSEERAHWLAHQFFCKLGSPGRIYRFERQAEDFFKTLLIKFRELAASNPNLLRTRRKLLKPEAGSLAGCSDKQVYNGHINSKPVSLMCLEAAGGFVTVCNLERLPELKIGDEISDLKDDDENNPKPKKHIIKSVEETSNHLSVYHPIIPLSLSPARFRVLVPLEAASDCVEATRSAWSEEFSRVWDRLPIRIGVVAFPRMTPFQAVIEAARNLEQEMENRKEERWIVQHTHSRDCCVSLNMQREKDGTELVAIPVKMPDGRLDAFYPYAAVEDKTVRYVKDFQHPKGQVYRHVSDLKAGDSLKIQPSLITTMFMDSTAERFSSIEIRYLSEWDRMRRIWDLLSQSATGTSALKGIWAMLREHRENYQGPDGKWQEGGEAAWLKLVEIMFVERMKMTPSALKTLVEAAKDCVFDWALHWHLTVLKQSVEEK